MRPTTRMTRSPSRDAPGAAHRGDAVARDRRRIEARGVDAQRHHGDAAPRRAVAVVDQFGDLVAHRDHAVAARHHAVVEPLERVLLAEALVPGGQERHAGHARRRDRRSRPARGRGRAAGRNGARGRCRASANALRSTVAGLWLAMSSVDAGRAGRLDFAGEAAAARDDDRLVTGGGEDADELDDAGIGGAGLQRRHDDENAERLEIDRRNRRRNRPNAG